MTKILKKAKSIIFSRAVFMIICILVQICVLGAAMFFLNDFMTAIYGASFVFSAVLIIYEVNRVSDPMYKICWITLISIVPIFGGMLYLFVRGDIIVSSLKKRIFQIEEATVQLLKSDKKALDTLSCEDKSAAGLFRYIEDNCGFPVYQNTQLKYFALGDDMFEKILYELEQAKSFILLESFIVNKGVFWDSVLDILKRKAAAGVEVKVLYDGMGCLGLLPSDYPKELEQYGIQCKVFAPLKPLLSTYQNNRDHRKITVIDGKTAFTGGINFADEYINRRERFGHWKDAGLMIKGEAVKNFTIMFFQMWYIQDKELEKQATSDDAKYLNPTLYPINEPGWTAPCGDSPVDNNYVGKNMYMHLLSTAEDYVYIMTPYLIPDYDLLSAMKFAAMRGVDVRIITPHIPDKAYAFCLTRSYYKELIKTGVKIYEYTPGFIHSKVCVADGTKAVVGTINFDFRSLFLHYECAVCIYKSTEIEKIIDDFKNTFDKSQIITLEIYGKFNVFQKFAGKALKIIAPLM